MAQWPPEISNASNQVIAVILGQFGVADDWAI